MDLMDHAPDAVKKALAAGVDAAEAFAICYNTRHVYVEDDVPKVAEDRAEVGLGLKVARGKKVAFASTTLADASDVSAVTRTALQALKQVPEDPDFAGLPSQAAKGNIAGVWDSETASASVERLLEGARAFTDSVREVKECSVPKAVFRLQDFVTRVVNSNSVDVGHQGTLVFAYLTAKAGSKRDVGEGILTALDPALDGLDFAELGNACARRASENREARPFRGKLAGATVIDPLDLGAMFIQTVATAVNGNEVHRKRSPWAGRIGGTVASAGVTVRDRPRLPKGLASCLTDDEGSATRDRTLVSAGVLRGYVADYERARLLTTEAGNGFRRCASTLEGAYTRPAVVEISNLVVEPGVKTLEDLIGEVGHGVYVEKFAAPEVNPNSGAFACEVRNATIIEKGELKDHVKYALLSGNFYEGLKNVDGIGRDPRPMHGFYGQPGCAYVPPMAFSGFELVGQT